jgi:hypothetical protein
MNEKFAILKCTVPSEFLDLNHTSNSMIPASLIIPRHAPGASRELRRTSGLGR